MYSASGNYNTALGYNAFNTGTFSNSTAIGYNSQPTANNQIMMGTSAETLVVPGDSSFNNNLTIGKKLTVNGDISANGNVLIYGNLIVQQVSNASIINTSVNNYQLVVTDDISLNGRLIASSDVSLAGRLYVSGAATFATLPTAPTATAGTNTTQLATTAFVTAAIPSLTSYAQLASPALTGVPTAPTATAGTNTTQLATTAFVTAAIPSLTSYITTTGSNTFTGTNTFNSNTIFNNDISANGNLVINGNTTFNNGFTLNKQSSVGCGRVVQFNNDNNFVLATPITGSYNDPLYANGGLTVATALTMSPGTGINGDISANNNVTIGKKLTVNGDISANGNITIYGNLMVQQLKNINVINTSVNNYQLVVTEDISLNGRLLVQQDASFGGNLIINPAGTATTGRLGIGTSTPSYPLHVIGQIGATSFNATSDYRIKTNVQPLNETFTVDNIKPITFTNTLLQKQDIGLIAHELQEEYPYLVTGEKDGKDNQTVNYTGLIGVLINEIQRLKTREQANSTRIRQLEERLAILENK